MTTKHALERIVTWLLKDKYTVDILQALRQHIVPGLKTEWLVDFGIYKLQLHGEQTR